MSLFRPVGLILIIVVFLALGAIYSVTAPYAAGPDEVAHFQFIRFVAQHHRLPASPIERNEAGYKSDLPPLFHLMMGLAGSGIDLTAPPFIKVTQNNPRLQLVVGLENVLGWRAINTEDPYRGEVLLWYLARWGALAGGVMGLGITYSLLRSFFYPASWLALSGIAVLAFVPLYLQVSSVISYESLTGALMAGYFWVLFRLVCTPARWWHGLGLGLLLGLAGLTRQTVWPVMLILPAGLLWLGHYRRWNLQKTGQTLALIGLGLLFTFGLWIAYTLLYFNQVTRLGWAAGLLYPFLINDGSDTASLQIAGLISGGQLGLTQNHAAGDSLRQWAWTLFSRMWGEGWLVWMLLALWLLALGGLVYQWKGMEPSRREWLFLLGAHFVALLSLPLVRFIFSGQADTAFGQHLLFPAGAMLILLLIWGLSAWLKPAYLASLLFLVAGGYLIQTSIILADEYQPPWPVQTVPLASGEQVLASFETMALLDYTSHSDGQSLTITLQWRTESLLAEDYRLELTLLAETGQAVSRWIGQPLNGRYPTRAWLPGDRVRTTISLPIAGWPPGEYQLGLRWLSQTGAVLPTAADTPGQRVAIDNGRLNLGPVSLTPALPAPSETVLLNGQLIGYTLWPQPAPLTDSPVYQENSIVMVSTADPLDDTVRVSLVGPDGVAHPPADQTGRIYSFTIEPHFASGEYRLRFEQRAGDQVMAQVEAPARLRVQTQERQFQAGVIAHPLQADFAGYVALLGYDLPERQIQPGGVIPVTLYWQALKPIGADLIMFNHLIDRNQKIWGGRDRRTREVYSTMLWAPGEVVVDSFNVQVQANAPNGIYTILVGLYLPVGQASVSLPLLQNGQLSDVTSISLGAVKVGATPPGLTIQAARPQVSLRQTFGDPPGLTLLGYDLTSPPITNYQLPLTLYWRAETSIMLDYTTFVHVRNESGETVTQKDQPPLKGAYPTGLWSPGEIVADTIEIPWPQKLPPGKYEVVVGWYDPSTGQRLIVPNHPANEVSLTDVELR